MVVEKPLKLMPLVFPEQSPGLNKNDKRTTMTNLVFCNLFFFITEAKIVTSLNPLVNRVAGYSEQKKIFFAGITI
jgi:hypothetical protein